VAAANIGVPLLLRSARGSTPTPAGTVLVEWAARLLTAAEEVEAAIDTLRTDRDRELRIVASMTIAEHLLPRWLVLLRQHETARGGALSVSLTATNSRAAVAAVTRGGAVGPARPSPPAVATAGCGRPPPDQP